MRPLRFSPALLLLLLAFPALGAKPAAKAKSPPPAPEPIFVMAYNVENLFDAEHDEGKDDWTYLPRSLKNTPEHKKRCEESGGNKYQVKDCEELDWSEAEVKTKLERIGKIVSGANDGKCPDLLFLEEVENIKILERLRTEFLSSCNYKPGILLEGDDRRGIDPGILTRFERAGEPSLGMTDFVESRKQGKNPRTRGLLVAPLKLPNGEILTAIGVHLPAPYHPFVEREEVMETLNALGRKAAEQSQAVIAGGDFNTNAKEDSKLYRQLAAPNWLVSHLEGCHTCLGTHYFRKEENWSFLDSILVWKGGTWTMDRDSVAVLISGFDFQTTKEGLPLAWKGADAPGQSDHLPITLELKPVTRPAPSKSR